MRAAHGQASAAHGHQYGSDNRQDCEAPPKDKAALEAPPVQQQVGFEGHLAPRHLTDILRLVPATDRRTQDIAE